MKVGALFFSLSISAFAAAEPAVWDERGSDLRLIKTNPEKSSWVSKAEVYELIKNGTKFRDITDISEQGGQPNHAVPAPESLPLELMYEDTLIPLLNQVSAALPRKFIESLSTFNNRFFNSMMGESASQWVNETLYTFFDGVPGFNVKSYKHKFLQQSLIATIPGSRGIDSDVVILSSHLDSLNVLNPGLGRAPGADGGGSGIATVIEVMRLLSENNIKTNRTVEFHFYAGKEGGLLGSTEIADHYANTDRHVMVDMHLDMTGVSNNPQHMGIVSDYTNPKATDLLRKAVTAYSSLEPKDMICGYACSDHVSWSDLGYRSVMPFESPNPSNNKHVNTESDTVDKLDFDHIVEFAKIAFGFVVEMAGIVE